ncbi:hypothetical protein ACBY01_01210 [Sphingomonas sp. ac-8]|uniref:hypothetical protein n=1 Tax=Sphingomonas sp. ac-8 TaxID=3242977 RepID=UPI003A7FA4BC
MASMLASLLFALTFSVAISTIVATVAPQWERIVRLLRYGPEVPRERLPAVRLTSRRNLIRQRATARTLRAAA